MSAAPRARAKGPPEGDAARDSAAASGAPARPWLVVQHVAHEGPGLIATMLEKAGIEMHLCRVDQGELLPPSRAVRSLGGLVVLGGPMGVHDDSLNPWLEAERELLAAAVEADRVVLGVCLGAQQLAEALGGQVTVGPEPEIGFGQVLLTPEGESDPVLGPAGTPFPCVHWHRDTFTVPDTGVRLAGNARFANQAFRVGARAYALQFHVEVDDSLATAWGPMLPDGLTISDEQRDSIESTGSGILERIVGLATA
jgi:GMP synthase-like glutamine amidotransferase